MIKKIKFILIGEVFLILSCSSVYMNNFISAPEVEQQDIADVEKSDLEIKQSGPTTSDFDSMPQSQSIMTQVDIPENQDYKDVKDVSQESGDQEVRNELNILKKSLTEKNKEFENLTNEKITLKENSSLKNGSTTVNHSSMIANLSSDKKNKLNQNSVKTKVDRQPSSETKAEGKTILEKESFSFWPLLIILSGVIVFYLCLSRLRNKKRFYFKTNRN